MNAEENDLETVRRETLEFLGTDDPEAVSHITSEMFGAEAVNVESQLSQDELATTTLHGHRMAYGYYQGNRCYYFYAHNPFTNPNNACGNGGYWYALWSHWQHHMQSRTCNPSQTDRVVSFTRK